jgi:hypothetical protein
MERPSFLCGPRRFLWFGALFDPLIQRLQHFRVHCTDHIDWGGIELFLGHARSPCVRKATIHSRITEPHHRDGKTNEHLLALGETFDGMRIALESSKISLLQGRFSSMQ